MSFRVSSAPAQIATWVLAAAGIYGISVARSGGWLGSLLGQPAFHSLVASCQLHVDFPTAIYAALLFNVIALLALLPPRWPQRAAFLLLALLTIVTPVHLWRVYRGVQLAGVHVDPSSAVRQQCIALLALAFLWFVFFRLTSARAFVAHLGLAFLLTAYLTSVAFP